MLTSNEKNSEYQSMVLAFIASKRLTREQFCDKIGVNKQILNRFLSGKNIVHTTFIRIITSIEQWEQMAESSREQGS